ncbi:MAG: replicative DNA helicase [Desulfovibrio sp.]|nr:MAG: replicative DNA helicase [Desulfovibrio sp.]
MRKSPPQNVEAEQAVLGGIFIRGNLLHSLTEIVNEDDFYFPQHRMIFQAIIDLYRENKPVDLVTVAERLKSRHDLEKVGGAVYLAELRESSLISAANAEYHAKIVRDKAVKRSLIDASSTIISECYEDSGETEKLLDMAEQTVFAIAERTTGSFFKAGNELVKKVFEELQTRYERQELVTGVPTGYRDLNEMTAGWQPSDLIIVAGRPSMGKTAFALNSAMRTAVMENVPTVVFSLEMSMDQLMQRMLCSMGHVDLRDLRRGYIRDEDWVRLYDAADHLSKAPIYIDDTPALGTMDLRARCRRLKMEKDIGLIVIDYLQLMRASRNIDSREQEISEISRSLKALAKELHVPVIALSQLNRKVEERTNKRPLLSDLRESGAIEQDADVIVFLYRDDVYNKREDNPKRGLAEIIIGKQRNGPTGDLELAFLKNCTAFEELDARAEPSEAQPA